MSPPFTGQADAQGTDVSSRQNRIPFAVQAAQAGFYAPLLAIAVGIGTSVARRQDGSNLIGWIVGGVNTLLIAAGLILSIAALIGMRKHGRARILGYASVGLVINGLLIYFMLTVFAAGHRLADRTTPMAADALRNIEQVHPGYQVIINADVGYRLEVPDVFRSDSPRTMPGPAITYAASKPVGDGTRVVIAIETLDGVIGPSELDPSMPEALQQSLPPGSSAALESAAWDGYRLDLFVLRTQMYGTAMMSLVAQIPLPRRSVQLKVVGPAALEGQLRQLMDDLLSSFHGTNYWRGHEQAGPRKLPD